MSLRRMSTALSLAALSTLLGACGAGDPLTSAKAKTTTSGTPTAGDTVGGVGGAAGTGPGGGTGATVGGGISVTIPEGGLDARALTDAPPCSIIKAANEVKVISTSLPVDLYFMVDRSGSMTEVDPGNPVSRWTAQTAALNAFIDASTADGGSGGIGMGIGWFPIDGVGAADAGGGRGGGGGPGTSSCNLADYSNAAVPVADLPGNAAALKANINGQTTGSGTPTFMAIQGAVAYATTYQIANPMRRVAIVLATDGQPNDCNSTVANVSQIAAMAFAGMPSMRTYVLGVGPATGNLDQIAAAGGTGTAFMVTNSGSDALLQALNAIRGQVLVQSGTKIACSQPIPPSNTPRALDYGTASVNIVVGNHSDASTSIPVPPVANATACGTGEGWYFDNAAQPTIIHLCPASCEKMSPEAGLTQLDVDIQCLPPDKRPPQ